MDSLESVINDLSLKKLEVNQVMMKGDKGLDWEIGRIKQYYSQFYQVIKQHESRVLEEVKR